MTLPFKGRAGVGMGCPRKSGSLDVKFRFLPFILSREQ